MNVDRIAQGLQTAFPGLTQVKPLGCLGAGFGSVAVETAGGVVFRIAKNSITCKRHKRENALPPLLREHITDVAIPEPKYYVNQTDIFPVLRLAYGIEVGYVDPDTYDKIRMAVLG